MRHLVEYADKVHIDLRLKKKIALVGNPNVGKSVVFGTLTGRYVTVSNYPGTTVEVMQGKASFEGGQSVIVDTPGVNSLLPLSEDERVARDILLDQKPEVVVQVADTKNLRRSLLLSLQVMEMGFNFVLDLNMQDEARQRGIRIDTRELSELLGVEVVETVATEKKGITRLINALGRARASLPVIDYGRTIESAVEQIKLLLPELPISLRAAGLIILSGDDTFREWLTHRGLSPEIAKQLQQIINRAKSKEGRSLSFLISQARHSKTEQIIARVMQKETVGGEAIAERLGRWLMSPLVGISVLIFIVFLLYKFVGRFAAGTCVDFLENSIFGSPQGPGDGLKIGFRIPFTCRVVSLFSVGFKGINWYLGQWSQSLALPHFLYRILLGEYGLISMGLTYSLAIVLPVVTAFFLAFGVLEDSGYLPRLAVMANRIFKKIGLSGKAVLPMVLGLGCVTMATLTTRILETRKQRIIATLLLALGIPCSAQLGVILGILGGISFWALFMVLGVVGLQLLLVGFIAARIIPGGPSDFIIEIPPLRAPLFSNIFNKTCSRLWWFLKEAVPLFLLGTLVLFILKEAGVLAVIERIAAPVVTSFLQLPAKATEAFIVGFFRRDYGAAGLYHLAKTGQMSNIQIVVSMVVITLFVPCVANFFVIVKEFGLRIAFFIVCFIFPFAIIVGGMLNFILRLLGIGRLLE